MKKYWKLLLMAAGIGIFTACEDVPEPYNIPTEGNTPSLPTADYIINQTFTSSLGDFKSQATSGSLAWTSDTRYGAIITGYQDFDGDGNKENKPGETYLISPEIDLSEADSAYVVIEQAINYAKSTLADDHHLLARVGEGEWKELPMNLDGLGTSFTYLTQNIQLPQEYMGKKIQLALKHIAHNDYSSTWEVKSLKVAKGQAPVAEAGETPVIEGVGSGTKDDPYDVPTTIKLIAAGPPTDKIYTKGIVCEVNASSFKDQYRSLTYFISNDGTKTDKLEVYNGYGLGGAKFNSAEDLKVGDEVIVYGQVINYNGTPEYTTGSQLYFLNGEYSSSGPSGDAKGSGTKEDPFNVAAAISGSGNAWVKAYIVGWIEGQKLEEGAHFNGNSSIASNLLIADSPDETNVANCMPVQLPGGSDARTALNLVDNPGNYKKEVSLYGSLEKYFGVPGLKSVSEYVIDGQGGETPSSDALFDEPFSTNQGAFTIDNKNLPSGISAVWTFSSSYGMVATAYDKNSKTNYASESWLVSPEIDLLAAKNATLTFSHGANYFNGACKDECSVLAKAVGDAEWTTLKVGTWPANDFKFVSSGDVDLNAFVGKKVQIAFRYTSTEKKAGTWEIKKVRVEDRVAEGGSGGGGDNPDPQPGGATLADFTNGDFETWENGIPTGWKSTSSASNATLSQSTDAHSGNFSVKVGGASQNKRLAYQELELEAGTYAVTFYAKAATDEGGSVNPGYVPMKADGNVGSYVYGGYVNDLTTSEWVKVDYEFTLSSKSIVCLVVMNSKTPGKDILVDDYTITKK